MHYYLDQITTDGVEGWAWCEEGIKTISIYRDGRLVGHAIPGTSRREDVRAALKGRPADDRLGFCFLFPPPLADGESDIRPAPRSFNVTVRFESQTGASVDSEPFSVPTASSGTAKDTAESGSAKPLPFPREVGRLLSTEYPSADLDVLDEASLEDAVRRVLYLAAHGPIAWRELRSYLLFLKTMAARFQMLGDVFPRWNLRSAPDKKDFGTMATPPDEMLALANHLYVLKSYGVRGDLCEFGTFKGGSTAMLSFACRLLGINMQAFDSFEGLPESASSYYQPRDFMGGIEEVAANVNAFGCADVVQFHKGYFHDSLSRISVNPMLIWMDVDLDTSATDVMTVLQRLPKESAVFSHECPQECFRHGQIAQEPGPHNVLPAILEAFRKGGRNPAGIHISGWTGAIWDAQVGVPVLPARLVRLLAGSS